MDRFDKNDIGAHIYENLENLTEKELLELSEQFDDLPMPVVEDALDTFKREYLPNVSAASLYEAGKAKRLLNFNIKTMLIAAVVAVMIVASSMVSFAAGAASNESKIAEQKKNSAEDEESFLINVGGEKMHLFVLKPAEDYEAEEVYVSDRPVYSFGSYDGIPIPNRWIVYADEQGNVYEFEPALTNEEESLSRAKELFALTGLEYADGANVKYLLKRFEAEDYFVELFMAYDTESQRFVGRFDTNFQIKTTFDSYFYCYNKELDVYREFTAAQTGVTGLNFEFGVDEGWEVLRGELSCENTLISKPSIAYDRTRNLNSGVQSAEEVISFRERLDAALKQREAEKKEYKDLIEKIEEKLNS